MATPVPGEGGRGPAWPDPAERLLAGASGIPAVLADGREWLLADGGLGLLGRALDVIRDRMHRDLALRHDVALDDVRSAAWKLLAANYTLEVHEGRALIYGADADGHTRGVLGAMFGIEAWPRSFTTWARASLMIAGLDPDAVPADMRPHILAILIETNRTVPADAFCDEIANVAVLKALRAKARKTG